MCGIFWFSTNFGSSGTTTPPTNKWHFRKRFRSPNFCTIHSSKTMCKNILLIDSRTLHKIDVTLTDDDSHNKRCIMRIYSAILIFRNIVCIVHFVQCLQRRHSDGWIKGLWRELINIFFSAKQDVISTTWTPTARAWIRLVAWRAPT